MGFGNTVNPPKKEDDFLNNAMSSLYSVRNCLELSELLFSSGLAPFMGEHERRRETKDCSWIWRDAEYWLYSQRVQKILVDFKKRNGET